MTYWAIIRPPDQDTVYWVLVNEEKSMSNLDRAFEAAKIAYPQSISLGRSRWRLVDAIAASFRTPEREGMAVLREDRQGCREPFYHWGFMVEKPEIKDKEDIGQIVSGMIDRDLLIRWTLESKDEEIASLKKRILELEQQLQAKD